MSANMIDLLLKSLGETCYMVLIAIVLATLIGLPLGVILTVTRKDHIMPNSVVHNVLGAIVNATRSTPFIILMVAIIPFTRMIVGSSIGTTAAIVPLTITAAPFIARVIESSLLEVDRRRFGRPGDPLRLSAFPDGCDDCHGYCADRDGAGRADHRQCAEPQAEQE